jgi:SAM-dependent methyltransferase
MEIDPAKPLELCIEVLQYVTAPDTAVREMARVLAPGGAVVLAVPFLHRADGPADRHRFTATRVRELCEAAGLGIDTLSAQGRLFGTVANQIRQAAAHIASRPLRWLAAAGVVPLGALLAGIDRLPAVRRSPFLRSFTTGYVVVGCKEPCVPAAGHPPLAQGEGRH